MPNEFDYNPLAAQHVIGSLLTYMDFNTPEGTATLIKAIHRMYLELVCIVPKGERVVVSYGRGLKTKYVRWSPEKADEILGLLSDGLIGTFRLSTDHTLGPWIIGGERRPTRSGWPKQVSFCFDVRCISLDGVVGTEWQEKLRALTQELCLLLDACGGFLNLDEDRISPSLVPTPYEYLVRTPVDHMIDLDRYARGCFWGNVLGPMHIEGLGGIEQVKRSAPVECIPFPAEDGPWVWLQTSPDICHPDEAALRRLYHFLKPILPTGTFHEHAAKIHKLTYHLEDDGVSSDRSNLDQ